jgi:uncharacterized protein YecT (DUF1311 family)
MRIFQIAMVFAVMAFSAIIHAQDCANAASQMDMNVCADQAYKKTDAELNTVFKQIVGRLKRDRETTGLLVTAQKSWLAFRDAQCVFSASGSAQGSVYPMLVTQCRDDLTQKRIGELKAYLHCEEGDMGCPVPSG